MTPVSSSNLFSKPLAILELNHDEFGWSGPDILGKVDVAITAPERTSGGRRRLGRSIRQREIKGLFGEKDHAADGVSVHNRFLARSVPHANETHQFVLEGHRIVGRVGADGIWNEFGTELARQRRRRDSNNHAE